MENRNQDISILEKFRKRLGRIVEEGDFDLDCALRDYEPYFYQRLDDNSRKYVDLFTTLELLTYYTDCYMVLNAKKKNVSLKTNDYNILTLFEFILDFDDLVAEISATPFLLEEMMKASLEFDSLSFLGKVNLYHYLEEEDKKRLLKMNPTFIEEQDVYSRFIETEDYIKHFEEQQTRYERLMGEEPSQSIKDAIITEICGFLKNLSLYDYENYINNIKDMAIFHYEYLKYAYDSKIELALYHREEMKEVIAYFEEQDMSTLAMDLFSSYNYGYLKEMVWFYLENYSKGFLEDTTGIKIPYEEVVAYTESNPKSKEKIKDKKTRI